MATATDAPSLSRLMPRLAAVHLASVGGIIVGAGLGRPLLVQAFAALFATVIILVAIAINRPLWGAETAAVAPAEAARRNIRLVALAYAWGALAMLAAYALSGVRWQHGWQYGAGMAVISAITMLVAHRQGDPRSVLARAPALRLLSLVNVLHGAAAIAALAWLIGSGKLMSPRGDWVANQIFLFGGLVIVALSVFAWLTHQRWR
ncbi:MAG TPA: hypothetical protein PK264_04590 [Hyphomicrobiaceae bacterium]|nr:hypothetical protein [Hyphomicrobiaceae bacterium]